SKEPAVAKDQLASNINRAVMACKLLIRLGHLPLAPHLYFPRFLDDTIASEREDGIQMGLLWLKQADEVWVFGSEIAEGMSREIAEAKALNNPVRMMPEPCKLVMELLAAIPSPACMVQASSLLVYKALASAISRLMPSVISLP